MKIMELVMYLVNITDIASHFFIHGFKVCLTFPRSDGNNKLFLGLFEYDNNVMGSRIP